MQPSHKPRFMKQILLILFLSILSPALCLIWAETPMLSIQTTQGVTEVPIGTIQSITYNRTTGAEMYVTTTNGTQTYPLGDIVRMSFVDVPDPTAIPEISKEEAVDAQKVLINGIIYVIRNGQVFTLKGEKVE